jgi:hypothetical protein
MPKPRPRRTPNRPIPPSELCDRYARLYTAAITDILDKRGCYHQTLPQEIVGLTPQMRIAGLAFPASGKVTRNSDPTRALRAYLSMLTAVPRDTVLVVQSNDIGAAAHFGELSAVGLRAWRARRRDRRGDPGRSLLAARWIPGVLPLSDADGLEAALVGRGVGAAGDDRRSPRGAR